MLADFFLSYVVTAGIFLALDFAWLSSMTQRFYRPQLGNLMREKIARLPSLTFYLIYTVVITIVVVLPALSQRDPSQASINGGLIGAASYATYNLTNAATLKNWPRLLTFVDLAWGTIATGLASWLSTQALLALS